MQTTGGQISNPLGLSTKQDLLKSLLRQMTGRQVSTSQCAHWLLQWLQIDSSSLLCTQHGSSV